METIYIHLLADFDASFKILEDNKVKISVNTIESLSDTIDLEINSPSSFNIDVYPITKKDSSLFSYSVNLEYLNNNLISSNDYIKIFKLPENHYILKFFPFSIKNTEISGDKLEVNDTEIKKLSFINDLTGRAKVEVLKVEEKQIKKENEYFVYTDENVKLETNPDLILLAFFEAYMSKDYTTCFNYLSATYATNLNKESLKEFFGDIKYCFLNHYYDSPTVALLYDKNASIFCANIRDNKIFDIYEIN